MRTTHRFLPALAAAATAAVVLSACTSDAEPAPAAAGPGSLPQAAAEAPGASEGSAQGEAARFVACLAAGGVTAQVGSPDGLGDDDLVYVLTDTAPNPHAGATLRRMGGGGIGPDSEETRNLIGMLHDDTGRWEAAASAAHFEANGLLDIAAVYAACEADHPGFSQIAPADDTDLTAMLEELNAEAMVTNLEFAQAAREAGFTWVPDPSDEDGMVMITLPSTVTEADFRALLDFVVESEIEGVGFRMGSALLEAFDAMGIISTSEARVRVMVV